MINSKKGVTLIELLAVIVIIGIIAGISLVLSTGLIEKTRYKADLANVKILNDVTELYIQVNGLNGAYFEETTTDESRMQILVDEGYINKTVSAMAKDASIYWSNDSFCWAYSLNTVAEDTSTNYVFNNPDTSSYLKSGTWISNANNLYSSYGLLFLDNPRSEYTITVEAKLDASSVGGYGIFFETTLDPNMKDTGYIVQMDRGYNGGSLLIRPRTNGTEGNPISGFRYDSTNSIIPRVSTTEGYAWWSSQHEVKLKIEIDPNSASDKILSVWIDGNLMFDDFSFSTSVIPSNNFTGLRSWRTGTEYYSLKIT